MLKETLLKCAQLLDRSDLFDELKKVESINEITNKQIQNDITKLICYYNFIVKNIYENYIDLIREDYFISSSERKIFYNNFLFVPIKILSAKSGEKAEYFQVFADYLLVNKANTKYKIEYKFVVDEISDINSPCCYKGVISDKILSEGIVSQFLASKGKFNESEYWNDKFMFDLFKIKCKKERRLKPHFDL